MTCLEFFTKIQMIGKSKNFAENIEVRYGTGSFIDLKEIELLEKIGEGGEDIYVLAAFTNLV